VKTGHTHRKMDSHLSILAPLLVVFGGKLQRGKRERVSGGVCAVSQWKLTLAARAHMFTGDIPPVQPVALENPDGF